MKKSPGPIMVLCLPFLLLAACTAPSEYDSSRCPPDWVSEPPRADKYFYGVGQCGPTFLLQDSWDKALTRAVAQLAAQGGVEIKSESLLYQKMRGSYTFQEWSQEVHSKVEGIIRNFTIVARHSCSDRGDHAYAGGTNFVLVRIERAKMNLERL